MLVVENRVEKTATFKRELETFSSWLRELFFLLELQQWVNTRGLVKGLCRGQLLFLLLSRIPGPGNKGVRWLPSGIKQTKRIILLNIQEASWEKGAGLAEQWKPPQFSLSYSPLFHHTPEHNYTHSHSRWLLHIKLPVFLFPP